MKDTGALCITDGLRAGDVFVFSLDCQTITVIRPNDPDHPSQGYRTVRWPNGNDKKLVRCISDRGSFLDFLMLVADTHGLFPKLDEQTTKRLAFVLRAR